MTNEEQLDDLKQFITTTVSQATAHLATKEDLGLLAGKVDRLEQKVDTIQSDLTDLSLKVDTISDAIADDLESHDKRLTRLEQSPA